MQARGVLPQQIEVEDHSKFDSPKRCPDALHRIALEWFLIAGW